MSKSKLNQNGFGAVELVIIAVIVIALAAGGYYVWHKSHKSARTTSATTSTSKGTGVGNSTSSSTARVVTTTLGNVPLGLQTAVSSQLKSAGCILPNGNAANAPGDTTGTPLSSIQVYYMANTAAQVNACDSFQFYSYKNTSWSYDVGGQSDLSCSTYLKYEIPAALIAAASGSTTAQCANASGTGLDPYTSN